MEDFLLTDWTEAEAPSSAKSNFESQVFQPVEAALFQLRGLNPDFGAISDILVAAMTSFKILRGTFILVDPLLYEMDDSLVWPTDEILSAVQSLEMVLRLRSAFQQSPSTPTLYLRSSDLDMGEYYLEQVAVSCSRHVIQTRLETLVRRETLRDAQAKARQDMTDNAKAMHEVVAQHRRIGTVGLKTIVNVVHQTLISVTVARSLFAVSSAVFHEAPLVMAVGDRLRLGESALIKMDNVATTIEQLASTYDPPLSDEHFAAIIESLRFIISKLEQRGQFPSAPRPVESKRKPPVAPAPKKRNAYVQGMLLGLY